MGEFEITYTFGYFPLQQYLVPFPGGRKQCLPIAWDVKAKNGTTYTRMRPSIPATGFIGPIRARTGTACAPNATRPIFAKTTTWRPTATRPSGRRSMSAAKPATGRSSHVKWAEMPEMGRPDVENYDLVVKTAEMTPREQIELCAPCHSRRMSLGDNTHEIHAFMDYGVPQLLNPGMYFADGQILEEVYVYGSFMQSKMYAREVRCSDCHDVHSTKRIREGNDLCLQCHRAEIYDTPQHHFHKKKGETGEPIRSASGGHSFCRGHRGRVRAMPHARPHLHGGRLPAGSQLPDAPARPESEDRHPQRLCPLPHGQAGPWSVEHMGKWYGKRYRPHYGAILDTGRKGRAGGQRKPDQAGRRPFISGHRAGHGVVSVKTLRGPDVAKHSFVR